MDIIITFVYFHLYGIIFIVVVVVIIGSTLLFLVIVVILSAKHDIGCGGVVVLSSK